MKCLSTVQGLRRRVADLEATLATAQALVSLATGQTERAATRAERASDATERALALLEGMTAEAKRRAEHEVRLEDALARAIALLMFGERPVVLDRMGALAQLRRLGLPEATPADLDAACEGLDVPWGPAPVQVDDFGRELRCGGYKSWPSGRLCVGCPDCTGQTRDKAIRTIEKPLPVIDYRAGYLDDDEPHAGDPEDVDF